MSLVLTKRRPDVVSLGEKIFQVQTNDIWIEQKSCQGMTAALSVDISSSFLSGMQTLHK